MTNDYITTVFDKYKIYRDKFEKAAPAGMLTGFPIHLDIELNTSCNLKCTFCDFTEEHKHPEWLPAIQLIWIINEASEKGCASIKFQYRGEPLLSPSLAEAIKLAKEKGIIDVIINTNATILNKCKREELCQSGLDMIICSVEGFKAEHYEPMRGFSFETVRDNVIALSKMIPRPKIRLQSVYLKDVPNFTQEYIRYWEPYCDSVAVYPELDLADKSEDNRDLPNWLCPQLFQRLMIRADGKVQCCCGETHPDKIIGDIGSNTVSEIWHSKYLREYRRLHIKGKSHWLEMCRKCSYRKDLIAQEEYPEQYVNMLLSK